MGTSILGTIISGVIVAGFVAFLTWFTRAWLKANKKRELHYINMECLIETLSTINGNFAEFSRQFRNIFTTLKEKKMSDENFINEK